MKGFPTYKKYLEINRDRIVTSLSRMFEWSGSDIDSELLEDRLITIGHLVAIKKGNKVYIVEGSVGGEPDYRNRPTEIIVANHVLGQINVKKDVNGVLLRSNTYTIGIDKLLIPYLDRLYHIDLSLHKATIDTRSPYIVTAPTTNVKNAVQLVMDKVIDGDFSVAVDNIGITEGIKTLPYGNANSNTITTLIEARQYVLSDMWAMLGIDINNNLKREALNQGETHINEDVTKPLIYDMLECRQEFCKKCNEIFGTDYTVEFGSIWKVNYDNELREEEQADENDTSSMDDNPDDSGDNSDD